MSGTYCTRLQNPFTNVLTLTGHSTETKELKFRPGTDVHDYQTKLRAAQRFVSKSNKVKVSLQFRGREMDLIDQGHEMCKVRSPAGMAHGRPARSWLA